jgi:hypothetical protein
MTMRIARTFLRCTALASLCGACENFSGVNCTLIGGESGLTVGFRHVTSPVIRVEVSPYGAGRQPAYVAECERIPGGCENSVFFPEYSAPYAAITVFTASGTQSGIIAPEYHTSYPNGPKCEPRLTRAAVIIDVRNGFLTNGS